MGSPQDGPPSIEELDGGLVEGQREGLDERNVVSYKLFMRIVKGRCHEVVDVIVRKQIDCRSVKEGDKEAGRKIKIMEGDKKE